MTAQFRTDLSCIHLPSTVGMKTIRQALDEHIHLCTFCAWYVCKLVIRVQCTDVYDKTLIVFEFNCIRPCVCVWEHVSMWQLFVRCCFAVGAVALNHVTILKSAKGAHGHQSSSRVECVESFNPRPQTPAKVYRTSFGRRNRMQIYVCTCLHVNRVNCMLSAMLVCSHCTQYMYCLLCIVRAVRRMSSHQCAHITRYVQTRLHI